jgi:hypothetical protein
MAQHHMRGPGSPFVTTFAKNFKENEAMERKVIFPIALPFVLVVLLRFSMQDALVDQNCAITRERTSE